MQNDGPNGAKLGDHTQRGTSLRKLRRADELAAAGSTGEEIAAELGVSAATLHNWRRSYGGMDTDAAKELRELRERDGRLKRLLRLRRGSWPGLRNRASPVH